MAPTPPRERTRRDIQEQATRLFARNGYEATSLHDIAVAVGCSKATVLYHFDGKPAVLGYVLEPPAHALEALTDSVRGLPPDTARLRTIDGLIDLSVQYRGLVTVLHEVLYSFVDKPEFCGLIEAGERLVPLLAGSDDPLENYLALFALNGVLAACRDTVTRSDDELRAVLTIALRRLLLPEPPAQS